MANGIARLSVQFEDKLLKKGSLRNYCLGDIVLGYEFEVASNGYRGTYLSCIEAIDFTVDGKKIDPDRIVFLINGKRFLQEQLSEMYMEYWFTTDYMTVRVYNDIGLSPGPHTVRYHINTRIPFSGYFGDFELTDSIVERTFTI